MLVFIMMTGELGSGGTVKGVYMSEARACGEVSMYLDDVHTPYSTPWVRTKVGRVTLWKDRGGDWVAVTPHEVVP